MPTLRGSCNSVGGGDGVEMTDIDNAPGIGGQPETSGDEPGLGGKLNIYRRVLEMMSPGEFMRLHTNEVLPREKTWEERMRSYRKPLFPEQPESSEMKKLRRYWRELQKK